MSARASRLLPLLDNGHHDVQLSPDELRRIIQEEEPTRLASIRTVFRGDIDTIVGKALEKDRTRRYETAAALANGSDLRTIRLGGGNRARLLTYRVNAPGGLALLALAIWRFSGEAAPGNPFSGLGQRGWWLLHAMDLKWKTGLSLPK